MQRLDVDVAVIGAGTAGLNARREAERAGKETLLIERGEHGTTCARVGCMPSKLLIAAADAAHGVHHAATFGVRAQGVTIDGRAVLERVREHRDRFVRGVVSSVEGIDEDKRLRGEARFVDANTLIVETDGGDVEVRAKATVIATGSSPWIPPPFEGLDVDVNDDVFEWEDLPESVAVIGTGIIGLELGQALHRLGVDVAFFNPFDEVGAFTDPKLDAALREILAGELTLHLAVQGLEATRDEAGYELSWDEDGTRTSRRFARVLASAGRRPNVGRLDLEKTGLSLDDKGRPSWDPRTCQCGDAPIFMAGDATGHRPVLHEASDEGSIAGENAARYPKVGAHVRRTPLSIAFTDPQIAMVGQPFEELPSSAAVGEVSFVDQGRAKVIARNRGLVRVYGERDGCVLLGAEMLGPDVEHLSHLVAFMVQQRLTVQQALQLPIYHPVLEEGLKTALRELARALEVDTTCRNEDLADCPGA